jgi:hypothetical protein
MNSAHAESQRAQRDKPAQQKLITLHTSSWKSSGRPVV